MMRRLRDESGISSIIVAICVIAFIGAAILTVDAGSLWSSRRMAITGTDAAVLHAAQYFNMGAGNPCDPNDVLTAESGATNVLQRNHPDAQHNSTATPDGFAVTLADPTLCATSSYVPGKVRYDGRLAAQGFFSKAFGFGDGSAISSSTAAWGYITALGEGLRPISVCDKSDGYLLWTQYWSGAIDQTSYNSWFGTDEGLAPELIRYPSTSDNFIRGDSAQNPNRNKTYVTPDGTDGHRTIQRVTMPSSSCGVSPGNRVWVDFTDEEGGGIGSSELRDQILFGYKGTVSLDEHDCNPANDNTAPEDCGSAPGDKATLEKALGDITCDRDTPAMSCGYRFPILVVSDVTAPGGANAHYVQVAFLFVVLRGFGSIEADVAQLDFEFVDVHTSGEVGAAPPTSTHPYQTGTQLCGVDHDTGSGDDGDRCPF